MRLRLIDAQGREHWRDVPDDVIAAAALLESWMTASGCEVFHGLRLREPLLVIPRSAFSDAEVLAAARRLDPSAWVEESDAICKCAGCVNNRKIYREVSLTTARSALDAAEQARQRGE